MTDYVCIKCECKTPILYSGLCEDCEMAEREKDEQLF